jgi:hypothetical protein
MKSMDWFNDTYNEIFDKRQYPAKKLYQGIKDEFNTILKRNSLAPLTDSKFKELIGNGGFDDLYSIGYYNFSIGDDALFIVYGEDDVEIEFNKLPKLRLVLDCLEEAIGKAKEGENESIDWIRGNYREIFNKKVAAHPLADHYKKAKEEINIVLKGHYLKEFSESEFDGLLGNDDFGNSHCIGGLDIDITNSVLFIGHSTFNEGLRIGFEHLPKLRLVLDCLEEAIEKAKEEENE